MKALPPGRHFGDDQPAILKVLKDTGSYKTILYLIQRPCCGDFLTITHQRYIEKVAKGMRQCRRCFESSGRPKRIRDLKRKERPVIVPPTWPKPPSVTGRGVLR